MTLEEYLKLKDGHYIVIPTPIYDADPYAQELQQGPTQVDSAEGPITYISVMRHHNIYDLIEHAGKTCGFNVGMPFDRNRWNFLSHAQALSLMPIMDIEA